MRKLTNISIALVAMLFVCAQVNAQQIICPAVGPGGQAITTSIFITNETQVSVNPDLCTYDVQATVETTNGMAATQDVEVVITATATLPSGSMIIFTRTITLPNGSISITEPTPAFTTMPIPCGLAFDFDIQITGGGPCVGSSFFPVELTKFEAITEKNNQIQLTWETASELENQGFEIERSREGKKWETLDFVKGAGTTSEVQYYKWIDEKPFQDDLNYYRLKQMDFDGTMEYSTIIVAELKTDKEEVIITPNPATDFLNMQLNGIEKEVRIEIYNSNGQIVKTMIDSMQNPFVQLDISDLPNSIYWVIISSGNSRQHYKFMKQ